MGEEQTAFDAVVVGTGPAGLTSAIALASAGFEVAAIGPQAPDDHRTSALLASSVTALTTLGVWERCQAQSAPLRTLRIVDDTARLFRAPEARFDADEIGIEAFAWNIANRHLVDALEARAAEIPSLRRIDSIATDAVPDQRRVRVQAEGRTFDAALAVGADGARSICRQAAGIAISRTEYPQIALTFNVTHSRQHLDISTVFHTEWGPFTTVPLPGRRSSIVCVVDRATAGRLQGLNETELARELERRSHSILGKIDVEPGGGMFPLGADTARIFAKDRIALVGESAHRIPPIGAQGLNLGLRDAAAIAEIAKEFRNDPGQPAAMARYEAARRADVTSRTLAVDLLNRSLLSGFLPIHLVRGLGLHLMNAIGPLRRGMMREGVMPRASQPRLMRGEALV